MDRADYAEPILRARAALRKAEELLMDSKPREARAAAYAASEWLAKLCQVCVLVENEKAQRDA